MSRKQVVSLGGISSGQGSSLKVFFEPTVSSLNYLAAQYGCKTFHMIGLSGGGWSTTLYSAMDTRIRTSFAFASGLMPHYLLSHNPGDLESGDPLIYDVATVQELFTLAGLGKNRRHVQVFIRYDRSSSNGEEIFMCNKSIPHNLFNGLLDTYDFDNPNKPKDLTYSLAVGEVQDRIDKYMRFKRGGFDLVVDESTREHQISIRAIDEIILKGIQGLRLSRDIKPIVGATKK